MNFLGYVEGWATYAENMSYTWTGLDDNPGPLPAAQSGYHAGTLRPD